MHCVTTYKHGMHKYAGSDESKHEQQQKVKNKFLISKAFSLRAKDKELDTEQ
jgi:hypothetical protein